VVGTRERDSEPSCSVNGREFLGKFVEYPLFKKGSAPRS
jgi:hypothetical protein